MSERVGVWLIGALGDVATTTVLGARAVARGLAPQTGLVSALPPLATLPLAKLEQLVFGGCDVRAGDPGQGARSLAQAGVVPAALVEALDEDLVAFGQRITPGVSLGAGEVIVAQESGPSRERRQAGAAAALAAIRADLRAFRQANELGRVVVVALASTEPSRDLPAVLASSQPDDALAAAGADDGLPASVLYALAAAEEGCAYANFTPSPGSSPRAVQALFEARGVPHMGNDGKTGQTLIRTALAPMFRARHLNVMSWSGFNVLGNRDGQVLDEPAANSAKTTGKDKVLGAILGPETESLTRIDYVRSLGDWKTAWDHVHFQGFLGTPMTLQVTWQGADSALAAPLVLDLVRCLELAQRRGRSGLQSGLASFFKTPLGVDEQDFWAQLQLLADWAEDLGRSH